MALPAFGSRSISSLTAYKRLNPWDRTLHQDVADTIDAMPVGCTESTSEGVPKMQKTWSVYCKKMWRKRKAAKKKKKKEKKKQKKISILGTLNFHPIEEDDADVAKPSTMKPREAFQNFLEGPAHQLTSEEVCRKQAVDILRKLSASGRSRHR